MVKVTPHAGDYEKLTKHMPADLKKLYDRLELKDVPSRTSFWQRNLDKRGAQTYMDWQLSDDLSMIPWRMLFYYDRNLGGAMGPFLKGLKDGKMMATVCNECTRKLVPPRTFCEWCHRDTDGWIELPSRGIVNTFTIAHMPNDPKIRLEKPIVAAVIWLDEGRLHRPASKTERHWAGLMHFIDEIDPYQVKIGMEVEAVWKDASEREGSILDIKYFRPVKGGSE